MEFTKLTSRQLEILVNALGHYVSYSPDLLEGEEAEVLELEKQIETELEARAKTNEPQ